MAIPEVQTVVSPAAFTEVFSSAAGDFLILLKDKTTNPKLRLIDPSNLGAVTEYYLNGVLQSSRSKLNIVSSSSTLTDDVGNEWAELTLVEGSDYLVENHAGAFPVVSGLRSHILGNNSTSASNDTGLIGSNGSIAVLSDDSAIFGEGGTINGSSPRSLVLGFNGTIAASTPDSVQIGNGTNSQPNTIQYFSNTFVNEVGLQLAPNTGNPDTVVNGNLHTLLVDDATGTDVYINTDGATAWSLISGGGASFETVVKTLVTDTADVGKINLINGTTTLNLPAGTDNDIVIIADYSQQFDTFPLTINPDGAETIQGQSSLTLSSQNSTVSLVFNGTAWTIWGTEPFVDFTGSGAGGSGGYAQDIGDGILTSIVVNHNLGTKDVVVVIFDNNSPFREVIADVDHTSTNSLTLGFTVAPLTNEYRVFVTNGGTGEENYTANSVSAGTDVTLTPGVSDNRQFISPTVASINCILLTAGADTKTFWTIVNDDPGTGSIDVKIDLAGNPTEVTLDNSAPVINVAFDGTDYKLYA